MNKQAIILSNGTQKIVLFKCCMLQNTSEMLTVAVVSVLVGRMFTEER